MYLASNTTYVEKDTNFPIHFALNQDLLGLNNWRGYFLNKDIKNIYPLPSLNILEYGEFVIKTTIDGDHLVNSVNIKVVDSSLLQLNDIIRINKSCYKITAIDYTTHTISLDKKLVENCLTSTNVLKVVYPDLLGRYYGIITLPENMDIGNYLLCVVDGSDVVSTMYDDISVVNSLSNTNTQSKINPLQSKFIAG